MILGHRPQDHPDDRRCHGDVEAAHDEAQRPKQVEHHQIDVEPLSA